MVGVENGEMSFSVLFLLLEISVFLFMFWGYMFRWGWLLVFVVVVFLEKGLVKASLSSSFIVFLGFIVLGFLYLFELEFEL